jgi:hypothetical protein
MPLRNDWTPIPERSERPGDIGVGGQAPFRILKPFIDINVAAFPESK